MIPALRSRLLTLALLLSALLGCLAPLATYADGVHATLSNPTTSVGEPVEYTITVEGSFDAESLPALDIDGIEVQGSSQGSQLSIINGNVQRRTSITYVLVPKREGNFLIPPMEVVVKEKKYKTAELKLSVTPGQPATQAGDLAFAEIRLGKKTAYIGEAVPVEVRVYVDASARWELRQLPVVSGSGFTLKPFGRASERAVEMAGKDYVLATFRSLVTPGKAGRITIGPLPVKTAYSAPAGGTDRRRRPYDMFGMRMVTKELEIVAPAVEMEAKLIPAAGRPADFDGAIGKFQLTATGTPGRVNVGEPVQMMVRIIGEGNFDRINVPPLQDSTGWRSYEAENQFEPTDELGFGGTKTFNLPVAPTAQQTAMPVFSFSYFNPETETYHTLKSSASPLTVIGAASAPVAAPTAEADTPPPTAPQPAKPEDILGILPQLGPAWSTGLSRSPMLLYSALLIPAPLLIFAWLWRKRMTDESTRHRHALRREKAHALQRVKDAADRNEVYDAAARVLQIEAALTNGMAPGACELADILAARALPPELLQPVEDLWSARASLAYAGGESNGSALESGERDWILETLSSYERSAAR